MGQSQNKRASLESQQNYFAQKHKRRVSHFTKSQDFMENSSEWIVIFRETFETYSSYPWTKPLKSFLKSWDNSQDRNTRVTFVWNDYTQKPIPKIDQSRTCLWPQSIIGLQTFTYEVEIDPNKKTLSGILLNNTNCTLHKLISILKSSLFEYYTELINSKPELRHPFLLQPDTTLKEIDQIVLKFIQVFLQILPKFFLHLPHNIDNLEGIVRNAIVSDQILTLLVLVRKACLNDSQNKYLDALQSFCCMRNSCPMLERLEKSSEGYYLNAIGSVLSITEGKSIGQIHDSVAMLMNFVSMGLFDEQNPMNVVEDEELIQAFLVIIGKSSVPDLPVYMSILNQFLDNNTLDVKAVGQGIVKLTFIIDNSTEWGSFIGK